MDLFSRVHSDLEISLFIKTKQRQQNRNNQLKSKSNCVSKAPPHFELPSILNLEERRILLILFWQKKSLFVQNKYLKLIKWTLQDYTNTSPQVWKLISSLITSGRNSLPQIWNRGHQGTKRTAGKGNAFVISSVALWPAGQTEFSLSRTEREHKG